jgi:predicted kinase
MNQTVIINVGASGSGKSTWSTEFIKQNSNFLRINRDDIRKTLRGSLTGYYQMERFQLNKLENYVSRLEEMLFITTLSEGYSIIMDNTHLKPSYIQKWIDFTAIWNEKESKKVEVKFKLFPENNIAVLENRVGAREGVLTKTLGYISKQVSSIRSAISYVEDNYKDQVI